jgi:hypothetical protein
MVIISLIDLSFIKNNVFKLLFFLTIFDRYDLNVAEKYQLIML